MFKPGPQRRDVFIPNIFNASTFTSPPTGDNAQVLSFPGRSPDRVGSADTGVDTVCETGEHDDYPLAWLTQIQSANPIA
jgi:hypothetical protein